MVRRNEICNLTLIEEERLRPSLNTIIDGINDFYAASQKRVESENWGWTHKHELNCIRKELLDIQLKLIELKKNY